MSVAWEDMLREFEPDYDNLKDIMHNGPKIVARMRTFNGKCRVRIEEDWGIADQPDTNSSETKLDKRCNWAAEQLINWRFVSRISYQEWIFFNRKQAEKFLTLYNLKWAE